MVNVSAKRAGTVVVFTVDVVRDSSTHSNEACAWSDREEPSLRNEYLENIGETDATLAADHSRQFVESENAVEASTID